MFSFSSVLLIGVLALFIGATAAVLAMKFLNPQTRRNRDLEEKLQQSEESFNRYQEDVTEHFKETSRLVNNLTQNYKEVHEYLSNSAIKLTNPSVSHAFLEAASQQLPSQKELNDPTLADDNPEAEPSASSPDQDDARDGNYTHGTNSNTTRQDNSEPRDLNKTTKAELEALLDEDERR